MGLQENTVRVEAMFGNYDILETVGQGGMGVVYRAHDISLDRIVALKVLKDDLRSHPGVVARFKREAEAFASLNHPNIVHIYSVGKVGKIPYIAMEYIEGEALSRVMKRDKRFHWKRALDITEQIAKALGCAHEAGIIHRDIKPGNILIDEEGHAFVTDFGIAKVLTAETQLTVEGSRLGTPQYMSPERCQNKEVTGASDIYSLGILLFQMLSGRCPHEAPTPVSLIRKIVSEPPTRISEYVKSLPENVENLVAYMVETKPENRPGPDPLVLAIGRVLRGKSVTRDESRLGFALENLRSSVATPMPTPYEATASRSQWLEALNKRWRKLSNQSRFAVTACAVVLLAFLAGWGYSNRSDAGYAAAVVKRFDPALTRWQQTAEVAEFVHESDSIRIVHLNLPHMAITKALWTDSNTAALELQGKSTMARKNQAGIVTLHLGLETATVAVPPVAGRRGPSPIRLLAMGRPQTGASVFLFAENGDKPAIRSAHLEDNSYKSAPFLNTTNLERFGNLTQNSPPSVSALDIEPEGGAIAIAMGASPADSSWSLVQRNARRAGAAPRYSSLTDPGVMIPWVSYSPQGDWVAYLREFGPNERELWRVEAGGNELNGRRLAQGNLAVGDGAIGPEGKFIVLGQIYPTGDELLRLIDVRTGQETARLGEGLAGAWHPSGLYIVAAVRDRKGLAQLWAIEAKIPHDRTQLTFLEQGVREMPAVSPDGSTALAPLDGPGLPSVVFVDLAPVSF